MKKKISLGIVSLIVLWGINDPVMGQIGVLAPEYLPNVTPQPGIPTPIILQQDVTARRGDANTQNSIGVIGTGQSGNPDNINNEFGAGETATISDGYIIWPAPNTPPNELNASPNAIQIGSEYSQNIVINTYNAGGYAAGWLEFNLYVTPCGDASWVNDAAYAYIRSGESPGGGTTITLSTQYQNNGNMTAGYQYYTVNAFNYETALSPMAGVLASTARETVDYIAIYVAQHGTTANAGDNGQARYQINKRSHTSPWTSTAGTWYIPSSPPVISRHVDDGIDLVQTRGSMMISEATASPANVSTPPYVGNDLTPYIRPTTVAIGGTANNLRQIKIKDLSWWYRANEVQVINGATYTSDAPLRYPHDCCHYEGGASGRTNIVLTQPNNWISYPAVPDNGKGNTLLDAAVQLLSGAVVCVEGNVEDATSTPGSTIQSAANPTARTNAMMVFPASGHNYSLLIGGDYNALRMKHAGTTDNLVFSGNQSAVAPAVPFPALDDPDIYLNYGTPAFDFRSNHTGYLYSTPGNYYTNLANPAAITSTRGSIFGVFGDYTGFSNIHTSDRLIPASANPDNPGVIEIGPATAGQNLFHIYSGGILKNFWSGCEEQNTLITVGQGGNAPTFTFDGSEPLYILNDGSDNTNSGIRITADAATTLSAGYAAATGIGPLHIQARSYVDIQGDIDLSQTGAYIQNTDVAILSDRAFIETAGFVFSGNEGYLTLWAKGAEGSGYIKMNGPVDITHTAIKTAPFDLGEPVWDPLDKNPVTPAYNACYPLGGFQFAQNASALNTLIQTRLQSDNDYVTLGDATPGGFTFTNSGDGALFVQGALKVSFPYGASLTLDATATADVAIQSVNDEVEFGNPLIYDSEGDGTDLLIDGYGDVTFRGGSITTSPPATFTSPPNIGIQSNSDGSVRFLDHPFTFNIANTANVQVWANKNIEIQSPLTYVDNPGTGAFVQFYANENILINTHLGGAPATFTIGNDQDNSTLTDWVAGGNIHAHDLLTFNYGTTGPAGYGLVRNLTFKSLAGNIVMTRPVNITYDSENTILLSAQLPCGMQYNAPANAGYSNGTGGNRNISNGNILINDSLNIERTNVDPGVTHILAKYNIRTAKVTMDDVNSTGNNVNIISGYGDIFLGYSAEPDGNPPAQSPVSYNNNTFEYKVSNQNTSGKLSILAGYDDTANRDRDGGGNIYFTRILADMEQDGMHPTEMMIPYSNEFYCGSAWTPGRLHQRIDLGTMQHYEHAGIIGGAGRCGTDDDWASYAPSAGPGNGGAVSDPSLNYKANDGWLILDAGLRGNIINNTGAELDFRGNGANAFFRTRSGDIDMRNQTNVTDLSQGRGLVFLADNGDPDKSKIGGSTGCDCDEENNNIYMQDFDFENFTANNDGSVYFGADNNIKLQYGGLKNIGTWIDPFLSMNKGYNEWGQCDGITFHCDSDPSVNKARYLNLDFSGKPDGGAGIVASDLIDIYKKIIYTGGSTTGMSPVPAITTSLNGATSPGGSLHGENVTGYGLYIKSQGNKKNWSTNPFELNDECNKTCPRGLCGIDAYLHQVARVTFHDDARIFTENSKVYIGSPVLEVFGDLELNTDRLWGSNSSLRIQTDSLILHDDLTIEGTKLQLDTWSSLERNMPVIKFGHQRFTPPFREDGTYCAPCVVHKRARDLDTIVVSFREDASLERLHTLVADHTVLTFQTDSFDSKAGNPVIDAKIYTDIFKVRNQVEMWGNEKRTYSGHFELISEAQMKSKNYPGIFTRHLHMEPIAPCDQEKYSELWIMDPALDVITTTTFGGYGTLHADVHVETQAKIAPGYTSLGIKGNCYENMSGVLKMQNLRLDKGSELHFSIGNLRGFDDQLTDIIEVDHLSINGSVNVYIEKRCGQNYAPGCYPIILYKTVGEQNLNNLLLGTKTLDGTPLSLDFQQTPGIVYLCVGEMAQPVIRREVLLPNPPPGVSIYPVPGVHFVPWGGNFTFTLTFNGPVYEILTNRFLDDGSQEILTGVKNANGEYEYTLPYVRTQPLYIYIGPNIVDNAWVDRNNAVRSFGNTLYINVNKQDIASIYSITGMLVKRIEVPDGGTSLQMQQGVFIVTLKDGSIHKVIIR